MYSASLIANELSAVPLIGTILWKRPAMGGGYKWRCESPRPQTTSVRRQMEIVDGGAASRLAPKRHVVRIAAEFRYVALHPFELQTRRLQAANTIDHFCIAAEAAFASNWQLTAAVWSCKPRFPGQFSSAVDKKPKKPEEFRILFTIGLVARLEPHPADIES